jgi:hypothetical protein
MKKFNVYKHPDKGIEVVKVGFSWPTLFFGVFWMLFKRLWGISAIWLVAYLVCAFIDKSAEQSVRDIQQSFVKLMLIAAYLYLWLAPPFMVNSLREQKIKKHGFELQGSVSAKNSADAVTQIVSVSPSKE